MKEILGKPLFNVLKAVMERIQRRTIAQNHRKKTPVETKVISWTERKKTVWLSTIAVDVTPQASSGPGSLVFFPLQLDSSLFAQVPGPLQWFRWVVDMDAKY
ncbi:hypothetical protein DPEC_G00187770 [Dallia pectoralis]|uniref:Uncharacterized protein n=1 Tax=Dallia pectoralis TaxID=75939 RepID=A0ACC2GCB6_DALPE|nr:hypothetical protein DPEC_G00187770 [Dallia pectoralis]